MKKNELDHVDCEILNLLGKNGRMSVKDLANEVYLSSPAASARGERLEKEGYITGYHATLNAELLGFHIRAFINLEVEPNQKAEFYPYIRSCPNVIECNCVTGDYSMLLEVLFHSTTDLDTFIGELQKYGRTKTLIVFSTSVNHREVTIQNITKEKSDE